MKSIAKMVSASHFVKGFALQCLSQHLSPQFLAFLILLAGT